MDESDLMRDTSAGHTHKRWTNQGAHNLAARLLHKHSLVCRNTPLACYSFFPPQVGTHWQEKEVMKRENETKQQRYKKKMRYAGTYHHVVNTRSSHLSHTSTHK